MVCPKCLTQMYQYRKVGGGLSTDDLYNTWEVKECGLCGRLVIEKYSVKVISPSDLKNLKGGELNDD